MTYRLVQGIDYGPRKGTLGWNIHMAEGDDGTVHWLSRHSGETLAEWSKRIRGVSATFVVLTTGEAVQMVPWDHTAGNLNPDDRSTDKAFYGRRFLLEVLPTQWRDPNSYTLSMEVCGFRDVGPNAAQVETMVSLIEESKTRYPGIRGAFGHADQTDTKGCPGTAPLMRQFWDRVGHGLWSDNVPGLPLTLASPLVTGSLAIPLGCDSINAETRTHYTVPIAVIRPAVTASLRGTVGESGYLVDLDGDALHFIRASAPVVFTPSAPVATSATYNVSVGGKPAGSVTLP